MSGSSIVVLGLQWGDEGKGKIVDTYSEEADCVVRFNGGNNAGHTLIVGDQKYVTHTLPSGIIRNGQINLVGPGVVCDLDVIKTELEIAGTHGASVYLDRSAQLIVPQIHVALDRAREKASGGLGTTGCGIGPCYEDLWGRRGLKLGHLVSEDRIVAALRRGNYYSEKRALLDHYGIKMIDFDSLVHQCLDYSELVKPLLADTRMITQDLLAKGKQVLFEGAQGILLDTFHGSQPYVTSSCTTTGGIAATFGIHDFDQVIGITKAYATRVGKGPFPTELKGEVGDRLRELGGEYGATTGRPRRCGWADWVALRYACRVGGVTEMIVTKADVLSGFGTIRVATEYRFESIPVRRSETLTTRVLDESEVEYTDFAGWSEDITQYHGDQDLPENLQEYLNQMAYFAGCPINACSVGPGRHQIVRWA